MRRFRFKQDRIYTPNLGCGVNIELTLRCSGLHDMARTILAPAEFATIAVGPDTERPMLFCRHWTLKEAYATVLGLGMSPRSDCMVFKHNEVSPHLLAYSDEWHLAQWSHTPPHTLAIAIRAHGPSHPVLHCGMPDIAQIQVHTRPI